MSASLRAYIEFWSEPDAMRRQTLLDACCSEQSEIIAPGYCFKGKRAVLDEAARFFRDDPGLSVVVTSGLDTHGQWWRFTMAVLGPSGQVVNGGWDVAEGAQERLPRSDARLQRVRLGCCAWPFCPSISTIAVMRPPALPASVKCAL